MNQVQRLLKNSKAVQFQFLFALFAIGGYSYIMTDHDINFFDGYVLDDIKECYVTNHSKHCEDRRIELGCLPGENQQLCLGNKYWQQLNKQAVFLAILLSVLRFIPSMVGYMTHTRRFTAVTVFEILWYGIMALIVFLAGVIDLFYYLLRKMALPLEMPWLNKVGLFNWTKELTGAKDMVNNTDLILTFIIGIGMLFGLFVIAMLAYRTTGLKRDMA